MGKSSVSSIEKSIHCWPLREAKRTDTVAAALVVDACSVAVDKWPSATANLFTLKKKLDFFRATQPLATGEFKAVGAADGTRDPEQGWGTDLI
jgi:hypothetical protein